MAGDPSTPAPITAMSTPGTVRAAREAKAARRKSLAIIGSCKPLGGRLIGHGGGTGHRAASPEGDTALGGPASRAGGLGGPVSRTGGLGGPASCTGALAGPGVSPAA